MEYIALTQTFIIGFLATKLYLKAREPRTKDLTDTIQALRMQAVASDQYISLINQKLAEQSLKAIDLKIELDNIKANFPGELSEAILIGPLDTLETRISALCMRFFGKPWIKP